MTGKEPTRRLTGAKSLSLEDQRLLKKMAAVHGYHALARSLHTSVTALLKLDCGGKTKPELVDRVSEALHEMGVNA